MQMSDRIKENTPDAIGHIDGRENPNVDRASQDATADRKPRTKSKKVKDAVNNIAEAFIDEAPGGKRPSTIKRLGTLGTYLLIAQLVYGSVEIHHLANYVREISSSQQNLVIEEKVFSDLKMRSLDKEVLSSQITWIISNSIPLVLPH